MARVRSGGGTCAHDDRGTSAVEFALVVVPLIYLLIGIITYGFMLSFRQSISEAVAEGARAAAVAPAGQTTAQKAAGAVAAINSAMSGYGVVCGSTSTSTNASNVTVVSGTLVHYNKSAGTCSVTGPTTCSGVGATAQCMTVAIDYTYRANSITPNLGLDLVLPSHLTYSTEVQINS